MVLLLAVKTIDESTHCSFSRTCGRITQSTFLLVIAASLIGYVALFFGLQKFGDPSDLASLRLP
ncbi:hypothetical protein ACSTI9_00520, partial [Vibrio parahaemolyticus]